MRIEVLKEFREIGHCLSYSEAAKSLNISQPNLSKHISELEREIGFQLFTDTRKIRLTPAGKKYLDIVCKILLIHDAGVSDCKKLSKNAEAEIRMLKPITHDEGTRLIYRVLHDYEKNNPYRNIVFISSQNKTPLENVSEGRVDLAVMVGGSNTQELEENAKTAGVVIRPIGTAPLVAWVHENNPLANKEAISWLDLRNASLTFAAHKSYNSMRYACTGILLSAGVFPDCSLKVRAATNIEEFYMGVDDEEICLMSPYMATDPALDMCGSRKIIPIEEELAVLKFFLAYKPTTQIDSILELVDLTESAHNHNGK